MLNKDVALYTGWGPYSIRNPGDGLCEKAAHQLLAEQGIYPIDVRAKNVPIREPWYGPLIIGGGTTLPGVFKRTTAPGLEFGSPIIVYGSGVLSPDESVRRGQKHIIRDSTLERVKVIGVRGPLSVQHFQTIYGISVDYVGDLGFAFAEVNPRVNPNGNTLFYLIEDDYATSRTEGNLKKILSLYLDLCNDLKSENTVLHLTNNQQGLINMRRSTGANIEFIESESAPEAMIESIKRAKFVITERFHPAVLAACFGIPFIYIQTTSKSKDLEMLLEKEGEGSLGSLFLDLKTSSRSLVEIYDSIKSNTSIPQSLIKAANAIKARLICGAQKVAQEIYKFEQTPEVFKKMAEGSNFSEKPIVTSNYDPMLAKAGALFLEDVFSTEVSYYPNSLDTNEVLYSIQLGKCKVVLKPKQDIAIISKEGQQDWILCSIKSITKGRGRHRSAVIEGATPTGEKMRVSILLYSGVRKLYIEKSERSQ